MNSYFRLQFRMLNRHLVDFGLPPLVAYVLGLALFLGFSFYLFHQTDLADYLLALIGISFLLRFSETERNFFLKSCFSRRDYRCIRLLENAIVAAPFLLLLLFKGCFGSAIVLLLAAVALALLRFGTVLNYSLPTPFYKRPFEFTVGFRNTYLLLLGAYFLAFMSVSVGNPNLGIFSFLLVFLVCMSFYLQPESRFFVWVHAYNSRAFLWQKVGTALGFSSLLCLPILLTLALYFPDNLRLMLICLLLGYLFLASVIFAKYSAYPAQMSLPQSIMFGLCLWFPPLLLGVVPFFYHKAIKQLNEILE